MLKILFFISIYLSIPNAFSAMEYQQGKRCTEFLGELSDETTRYNFTRTGPRGSYNVVEVPTYSESGKYVTVYTETGYSEINTQTGYCNSRVKDPKKNRKQKLLEMFKKRDEQVTSLSNKLMAASANLPMAYMALKTFGIANDQLRRDCAADFPEIHEYLEKNNKLPKAAPVYVDPVAPMPGGMNPYNSETIGIPPR